MKEIVFLQSLKHLCKKIIEINLLIIYQVYLHNTDYYLMHQLKELLT